MSDAAPSPRGLRIHPVDLLVLALAAGLASLAYAYLFRTTPVPRTADGLLGTVMEVEFVADQEWKRSFPAPGSTVMVDDFLACDPLDRPAAPASAGDRVRLSLRVRDREAQRPEAMTHFRSRLRRGTKVRLHNATGEIDAEVVGLQRPGAPE